MTTTPTAALVEEAEKMAARKGLKMEPKIQLEIGKESLLCKLTPEEREERLQAGLLQVARAAESRAKEAALKEAAKDAKEEAESADREMRRLFGIVKAGGEQRGVEVVTVFDAASGMGGGEVRSEPREPKGKQRRTEEVTGSVH